MLGVVPRKRSSMPAQQSDSPPILRSSDAWPAISAMVPVRASSCGKPVAAPAIQRVGSRTATSCAYSTIAGACLAGAVVSEAIRGGVVRISTGSWFDPTSWEVPGALEKNGNPNVLTLDIGTSRLSQGCSAQTCLVEVECWHGEAPLVTAYDLPLFEER